METRQNHDVQATERVFKKVVYPGLETLKVVDNNGIPVSYTGLNSFRTKSFILSPRGVPMKTSNHVYSGYHSHPAKVSDLIDNGETTETHYGQEKTFLTQPTGSYSAKLPRKRNESPLQQQKRAATSFSTASKQTTKSITGGHYLTGESPERQVLQSANSNYWNLSNQGLRLQREWTSLSNTRSIKRSSEIVNHRVDRMYFMSGNSIPLKPRYDVDDEELRKMKEQQAKKQESPRKRNSVRTSSRNSMKSGPKKKEPIDIQKNLENPDSEVTGDITSSSDINLKKADGTMSPIQGWDSKDKNVTEENVIIRQKSLHQEDNEDVHNGEQTTENKDDIDELQGMRPDGRIDSSALSHTENSEQNVVTEENQGEINSAEKGETIGENVAQDNT